MRTPTGRVAGHQDDPKARYGRAIEASRTAIAERVAAAAGLSTLGQFEAAEELELVRAALHAEVDLLIDTEALRQPEVTRVIFRCPTHADLLRAARNQ